MRLHQGRGNPDFRRGRKLGQNDRIVVWHKPPQRLPHWSKEEYDQLPKTLTLRILRFEITVPGFRSKEVILVTTLLDPKLYPAQELEKLDFRRWNVELHFRQIKTMLGIDVLRCLTPEMVLKELAMHRIAYNLIRALMQRAALTYDVDWSEFPSKALWTASIITQMPSMPRTASLVNRPSSSMLCFARSPPIWSRCAERSEPRALENVAQKTINYLPNLQKNVHRTTPKPAEE